MPTVEAEDGQIWGYGRFGRRHGQPILLHHGLIADAKLAPIWDRLGEENGFEWIVIERPGYGKTPPVMMTRVADWPTLIAPLLDVLGISGRFSAVGLSAGAPYAYALAAAMPERVARVCVLSGVPFLGADGVLAAYPGHSQAAYACYAVADETALRAEFRVFCESIAAEIGEDHDIASALAAIFAHDTAGPAREARLQATDWGFDRGAIRCPVDIWHSQADDMVPFAAARLSADGLLNAGWHIQAAPSHFPSEATLKEMTRTLARADN